MRHLYLLLFLVLLPAPTLVAQEIEPSPQRALNTVFEKGNLMAALSGQQWRPGLNLAAAYLSVGQSVSLNVTLREGVNYVFLSSGPSQRTDVDLYLRDAEGNLLAEDVETDGTPVVEFKATASGTFQLQLHLAAGDAAGSYVALSLLQGLGEQVSEQDFRRVSTGFFGAAKKIRSSVSKADWQKQAGTWCLFGYLIKERNGVTLNGVQYAACHSIFTASGPERKEIKLYLATEDGHIVESTDKPSAYPLLKYDNAAGEALDLRVGVGRSKSPVFVLVGVFNH